VVQTKSISQQVVGTRTVHKQHHALVHGAHVLVHGSHRCSCFLPSSCKNCIVICFTKIKVCCRVSWQSVGHRCLALKAMQELKLGSCCE